MTVTIHHQVKPLQDGHTQQDVGADDHRILVRLTAHKLDGKYFRDINFFYLIVHIACRRAAKPQQP